MAALAYGVSSVIPVANTGNGVYGQQRLWKYGELVDSCSLSRQARAAECSYFKATNPTFGTGIAGISATSFNTGAANQLNWLNRGITGASIFPDYIRMTYTMADASSGTFKQGAIYLDSGPRSTVTTTTGVIAGGTPLVPCNVNSASFSPSNSQIVPAPSTNVAATSNWKRVTKFEMWADQFGTTISHYITFGGWGHHGGNSIVSNLVTVLHHHPCPPVVIEPGSSMIFYHWIGNTPTTEWEIGWWER